MTALTTRQTGKRVFLTVSVLLLLFTFAIRVFGLLNTPIEADQARHIIRAHAILLDGQIFAGLDQNKWFYGMVIALFDPTGPEGVWIAKYVNVLWAAVTVSACIELGRVLKGTAAGLLAGLLYLLLPLAYFLDRSAFVDPQTTVLSTLALVFMIRWARSNKPADAGWIIVTLLLARLTKPSMILYFGLPVVAYVLFRWFDARYQHHARQDGVMGAAIYIGIITTVPLILTEAVYLIANFNGVRPEDTHQLSLDNTILGSADVLARIANDLVQLASLSAELISAVVLLGLLLAVVWLMLRSTEWRAILFLLLPAVVFLLVPLIAERPASALPARYLMLSGPPLAVLAALGFVGVSQHLSRRQHTYVVGLALVGAGTQMIIAANNPRPLPEIYYVLEDAAAVIMVDAGDTFNVQPLTVATTGNTWELQAYLGSRVNNVVWFEPDSRPDLHRFVAEGQDFYIMEPQMAPPLRNWYSEAYNLTLLMQADRADGRSALYRSDGFSGDVARLLYSERIPEPNELAEFYQLLEEQPLEGPLYVFPRRHFDWYTESSRFDVQPLPVEQWPVTAAVVETIRDEQLAQHEQVNVLLVEQAVLDPTNTLIEQLQLGTLYQINDVWFGPLHVMSYATGPAAVPQTTVNVTFEDAITLKAATIVAPSGIAAGTPLLVQLNWQTNQPIADSFTMFAHLLNADNQLVAQRDRLPGNGTLPTNAWPVDIPIHDQFALETPRDLPAGDFRLVVGLYNADSGSRLRVTTGGSLPDAAEVGAVTIE